MTAPQHHRYSLIQGLRFISALMVILCHATFYIRERLDPHMWFYNLGANGVSLFFVISGFVIVISTTDHGHRRIDWREFAKRRFNRIVPLYWLFTTVKLIVMLASVQLVLHARFDPIYIAKSYLFIPASNSEGQLEPLLGVGWTLNFEVFFYGLVALALLFRTGTLRICAPVLLILFALSFKRPFPSEALSFYANPLIIEFLYGMMIATWASTLERVPPYLATLAIVVGLTYLFVPRLGFLQSFPEDQVLFGIASSFVVMGLIALERTTTLRAPDWLSFLGAASFSMYLIHPLVTPLVPQVMQKLAFTNTTTALILCLIVALSAGVVSYVVVEKRLTRWLSAPKTSRYESPAQ